MYKTYHLYNYKSDSVQAPMSMIAHAVKLTS